MSEIKFIPALRPNPASPPEFQHIRPAMWQVTPDVGVQFRFPAAGWTRADVEAAFGQA